MKVTDEDDDDDHICPSLAHVQILQGAFNIFQNDDDDDDEDCRPHEEGRGPTLTPLKPQMRPFR